MKTRIQYFFGILFLLGCMGGHPQQLVFIAPKSINAIDTLTMAFVGDIMCHKPQVVSAREHGHFDFDHWFQYVEPILSRADLAIGNLETTLADQGPFSGYPQFKSPDTLATALKRAGFDVLVTSNNHSNDTRAKGLIHTIQSLKENGLLQTGTFINNFDKDLHYPLIIRKKDFKIALLNYTYDTNGIPTPDGVHVNLIDTLQIKRDIQDAKRQEPDILLAFMHWGGEYRINAGRDQKRLAMKMLDLGVDHIIGSHPHVVQPVEIISIDDEEHLVGYSLGNFISNQRKTLTDGGIILELDFVKQKGRTKLSAHRYVPLWRYIRNAPDGAKYEILPISVFERDTSHFHNLQSLNAMARYAKHVRSHLQEVDENLVIP